MNGRVVSYSPRVIFAPVYRSAKSFTPHSQRFFFCRKKMSECIDLQEIVEAPNQSPAMPEIELTEHDLDTAFGIPCRVFVPTSSPKGKTAIITFHDIGTNHKSMLSFFNSAETRILTQNFTIYHICAPGHQWDLTNPQNSVEEHHQNAAASYRYSDGEIFSISNPPFTYTGPSTSPPSNVWPVDKPYPTMDELAELVELVVEHFSVKYFIGFGVGAGSNVLARYALKYPKGPILGLFLLNPNDSTHSYYQWFRLKWFDLPQLARNKVYNENLLDMLDNHWFGWNQCENQELADKYEAQLRRMCPVSVAGYIQSYIDRTNLGLAREIPPATGTGKNFRVDCCLVTGTKADDWVTSVFDMNSRVDPEKVFSITIPESSGMVMEENPSPLAMNLLHFLHNLGLAATLSAQQLKRKVSEQHCPEFHSSMADHSSPSLVHFNSEFVQ